MKVEGTKQYDFSRTRQWIHIRLVITDFISDQTALDGKGTLVIRSRLMGSDLEESQVVIGIDDITKAGYRDQHRRAATSPVRVQTEADCTGTYLRFRSRLKDCRSCALSGRCMRNKVTKRGRQLIIRHDEKKKASYLELMKQKVDSEAGSSQYSKRMWVIEPVFGNITSNKRLDKFSLRAKAKVTGQWL